MIWQLKIVPQNLILILSITTCKQIYSIYWYKLVIYKSGNKTLKKYMYNTKSLPYWPLEWKSYLILGGGGNQITNIITHSSSSILITCFLFLFFVLIKWHFSASVYNRCSVCSSLLSQQCSFQWNNWPCMSPQKGLFWLVTLLELKRDFWPEGY